MEAGSCDPKAALRGALLLRFGNEYENQDRGFYNLFPIGYCKSCTIDQLNGSLKCMGGNLEVMGCPHIVGIAVAQYETNASLIAYVNAVLLRSIALKRLQVA